MKRRLNRWILPINESGKEGRQKHERGPKRGSADQDMKIAAQGILASYQITDFHAAPLRSLGTSGARWSHGINSEAVENHRRSDGRPASLGVLFLCRRDTGLFRASEFIPWHSLPFIENAAGAARRLRRAACCVGFPEPAHQSSGGGLRREMLDRPSGRKTRFSGRAGV